MINWILDKLHRLPTTIQYVIIGVSLFLVITLVFSLFSQVQSCGYNRARTEYQQKDTGNANKVVQLLESAALKDKQIIELQTKVQAYQAAAEAGKKVDAELAKKIEEVGNNATNQENNASVPVDCHIRASRVCALLRANNIPGDCSKIERESCSTGQ